ncbi:Mpv17/PMP22 [Niveomyces insectorum RCEF 264]|uniref:Mpv17/PMP22 n=1 Tax=Niveomyces insectorum RCEF 264 TaxID=1081102 RepID=A0A167QAT8_9HYPO|nr:Mpv17/PMP22 [Niveomyces insectorum RCEF 264]
MADVQPVALDAPQLLRFVAFTLLTARLSRKLPQIDWPNTLAKWFLDCMSLGMFLNKAAFIIIMGLLKGQTTAQIRADLEEELVPIILTGYWVWPVASLISFTCVPLERRIAWLSLVGLLWGVYMSLVAERV